jgi:hypothetical protein
MQTIVTEIFPDEQDYSRPTKKNATKVSVARIAQLILLDVGVQAEWSSRFLLIRHPNALLIPFRFGDSMMSATCYVVWALLKNSR